MSKMIKAVVVNDLNSNALIVKSNDLIEASYSLTTQEQKIILLVSSMIGQDDLDFQEYFIDVQSFMEAIGVTGHSKYSELKEITRKLRKRDLIIKNLENRTETQVGWVSSFTYFDGKGYVQIRFDPALKPYFLNLKKRFTQYQRKYVLALKSFYSIRMYELLKQYEKVKERYFDLIELKKILGISVDKYKLYSNFKMKVLKKAETELSKQTDIQFSFKEKKQGKKVVGIYFFIEPNEVEKDDFDFETTNINIELYLKLQNYFCLTLKQARQALKMKTEEELLENLAYAEEKIKTGEVNNIGSYTWKIIEENIKIQRSLFEAEEKKINEDLKNKEKQKQKIEDLKETFYKERTKKISQIIESLLPDQKESEEKDFEDYMKNRSAFDSQRFKEKGVAGLQFDYQIFIGDRHLSKEDNDFILWAKKHHNLTLIKNADTKEFEFKE